MPRLPYTKTIFRDSVPACGTTAGYHRHKERHQPVCTRCWEAISQYRQDRRLAPQRRAVLDAEVAIFEKRHGRERAA